MLSMVNRHGGLSVIRIVGLDYRPNLLSIVYSQGGPGRLSMGKRHGRYSMLSIVEHMAGIVCSA